MVATDTLPTQDSAGLSIVDWRRVNAGDVMRGTNGQVRLGVLPAHTNDLVTSLSSMAVSVAPFNALVSRTGAALGAEKMANASAETVSLAAAPSSNSRIDVVWVRPLFVASGDSSNVPIFGATTGTAASIPSKPTIPAGALELATVRIPSTATTTQSSGVQITQTFAYTTAAGGTLIFRNDDEMAAFTPPPGVTGFRLDTRQMWSHDGSNWTLAQPGSVLIRPGNVSGGTIDATGTVLVSGGSSVRLDDCFSARYRHYRVVVRAQLAGSGNMRMFLTRGGVDRNDANYHAAAVYMPSFAVNNTAAQNYHETGATNWFLQVVESSKKLFALDFFNPMQGADTYATAILGSFGGQLSHQSWSGSYESANLVDGFRLAVSTPSGMTYQSMDVKVYAYA